MTEMLLPFFIFVLSGTVHEFAHAWSAFRLGDPTARDMGRVSLNPLVHIDFVGTVVVPLIIVYYCPYAIGWMKPVPVDTSFLRNPVRDSFIVSLAGPFSNLLLAFSGAVAVCLIHWVAGFMAEGSVPLWLVDLDDLIYYYFIPLNLMLAAFNLLPVPPLDGSSIVDYIRNDPHGSYHRQAFFGMIVVYLLVFSRVFDHLWSAAYSVTYFLALVPLVSCALFVLSLVTGLVFNKKTSEPVSGRVVRPKKRSGPSSRMKNSSERALAVAQALARGEKVSSSDAKWFAKLKEDRGDGQSLCAPISYSMDNDFCQGCANLTRCLVRDAEEQAARKSGADSTAGE